MSEQVMKAQCDALGSAPVLFFKLVSKLCIMKGVLTYSIEYTCSYNSGERYYKSACKHFCNITLNSKHGQRISIR